MTLSVFQWTMLTAVVAAMSCALPGAWLMLRRHSMLGDALSHTALPAIVVVVLLSQAVENAGWMHFSPVGNQVALFVGATLVGLLTAWLTEFIEQSSPLDSGAALGVVFTGFFAIGLLLLRRLLDKQHIDPDCVFFGSLDVEVNKVCWSGKIPAMLWVNGAALVINGGLTLLFFKELRLTAFDPELAHTLGFSPRRLHYGLLAATSITLTAAFHSVGTILAIGLLSAPAATASLLTRRLQPMLLVTLLVAVAAAALGCWTATWLPGAVLPWFGIPGIQSAQTPAMIAVAAGVLFLCALLAAPQEGVLARVWHRQKLGRRIAAEDLLGILFRIEESAATPELQGVPLADFWNVCQRAGLVKRSAKNARRDALAQKLAREDTGQLRLTESGRAVAARLIRGHRLWESYLQKHFDLPDDHLHSAAHVVEHFLDADLDGRLSQELNSPVADPHGKRIPDDVSQ